MRVNFNDPSQKICCVKISKCFKILCTGLKNGKIKVYYLTEEADPDTDDETSNNKDFEKEDASAMREENLKNLTPGGLNFDSDTNFSTVDCRCLHCFHILR